MQFLRRGPNLDAANTGNAGGLTRGRGGSRLGSQPQPCLTPMDTMPPPVAPVTEDKTVAILSYLTLIGFIVAVVLHTNKKTRLGAYHLRQTLGFVVAGFAVGVISMVPFIGWLVALVAMPLFLVLWLLGLIAAINGQLKPVPLIGDHFQKWFANTFD